MKLVSSGGTSAEFYQVWRKLVSSKGKMVSSGEEAG